MSSVRTAEELSEPRFDPHRHSPTGTQTLTHRHTDTHPQAHRHTHKHSPTGTQTLTHITHRHTDTHPQAHRHSPTGTQTLTHRHTDTHPQAHRHSPTGTQTLTHRHTDTINRLSSPHCPDCIQQQAANDYSEPSTTHTCAATGNEPSLNPRHRPIRLCKHPVPPAPTHRLGSSSQATLSTQARLLRLDLRVLAQQLRLRVICAHGLIQCVGLLAPQLHVHCA